MKKVLLFCTLFLVFTCITNAQTTTLFGGLAFPQSDFGDDNVEDFFDDDGESGLATMGYGAGFEYSSPLQSEGLSWVFSGSFFLNGVDEDEIEKEIDDDDVNIDFGSYYNIPIMAGLKYESKNNPDINFYFQGMAGLNIAMIGDSEISLNMELPVYDQYGNFIGYEDVDIKQTYSFDTATTFGFGLGGGIILNNVNIGLRYLLLGTAKFEGEIEIQVDYPGIDNPDPEEIDNDQPISILLLTLGIQLN